MTEKYEQPVLRETEILREQAKQLMFSERKMPGEKQEGLAMMIRACDAGDPEAMCFIGEMLLDGRLSAKKGNSVELGVSLLCRSAKGGFVAARTLLFRFRRSRYLQTRRNDHLSEGPLAGFDGKEIHINRTGALTPVDARLTYEDGRNVLTLSLNLDFMEDGESIPDVQKLHEAAIQGIMDWAGEYTVFGGQKLHVDIHITTEQRVFDNVIVYVCSGSIADLLKGIIRVVPTKSAKKNGHALFRERRAAAGIGKKWSVRSRKIIFLQTSSGRFDDYTEITESMRHEFGHVLGLSDLYPEQDAGMDGVPAGTYPELDAYVIGPRMYDLTMCNSSGKITDNDMEMVVLAFSKNSMQAYQPVRHMKIVSEALGRGN